MHFGRQQQLAEAKELHAAGTDRCPPDAFRNMAAVATAGGKI